ncbi:solute carrier family 15 member 4-like [Ylistrum balloti]|uniref:solute carrier family 15 member 4-like n=1 Tax=Ylistrum balloti TaxID=509963 RepID=UPI0029059FBF|nr:solute carrier family 15 member 4-like [Ylistrum balloti]
MDERRRLLQRTQAPTSRSNVCPGVDDTTDRRSKLGRAAILLTVVFERCVFYGLTGNLVLYFNLDPYQWTAYNALLVSYFFTGISFLTSFVGGFLGDALFGRFKTLMLSFIIYCVGYIFLPVLSYNDYKNSDNRDNQTFSAVCWPISKTTNGTDADSMPAPFEEPCSLTAYLVLFVIAVGTGIFRANMPPFGGDQTRGEGHTTFFNWYYWSVNIGTLLALSVITWVQQTHSFFMGFLLATTCLGVSFLIFMTGSCSYTNRPRVRTVLQNIFSIIKEAGHRWRHRNSNGSLRAHSDRTGESSTLDNTDSIEITPDNKPACCLDYAKFQYGGSFNNSQVEDVKKLGKIICVFLAFIPYWMVYFQLVAAWFSLFDVIFVILLIPLVDRVLYPKLAQWGRPITMVTRIYVGMFFACIAVVLAGVVENQRLKQIYVCDHDGQQFCRNFTITQIIGNSSYDAADMSVFWQVPQYALIGVSEVFACVAGIDFAYQMAPRSMKGIIMGLFHLFTGVGSFLGIGAMYSFQDHWFFGNDYGDINCRSCDTDTGHVTKQCHLDYYFFFLGGLQLIGLLIFIFVACRLQLTQDLSKVASKVNWQTPNAIQSIVENDSSYSSMNSTRSSPCNNTYGRKSEIRVSIQRQRSGDNS